MGSKKKANEKVKERQLGLFGHICRMKDNRLIKLVVMGSVDGK
jgi:hypothetical protein